MSESAAAAEITALKDAYYAATKASAANCTRETVDATIAAGRAVEEACEAFRRRYYPRAHRVVCAQGEIFTVSKTGRSIRRVYEASAA